MGTRAKDAPPAGPSARLGQVRVDHVRPEVPEDPDQLDERHKIAGRMNGATELRDDHGLDPAGAGRFERSPSSFPATPVMSVVSNRAGSIPAVKRIACRAGPPTLRRVMIRATRIGRPSLTAASPRILRVCLRPIQPLTHPSDASKIRRGSCNKSIQQRFHSPKHVPSPKCASTRARPARPKAWARSDPTQERSQRPRPVRPDPWGAREARLAVGYHLGRPPTAVATTGRPVAMASRTELEIPAAIEVCT